MSCRLADVPRLAAAQWRLLREGLAALSADWLQEISRNMATPGDVVWSNHDAIDQQLAGIGEAQPADRVAREFEEPQINDESALAPGREAPKRPSSRIRN